MSNWNHRMCGECWIEKHLRFQPDGTPEFRIPMRITDDSPGICCFCGQPTRLGIYVRHDPKTLPTCACGLLESLKREKDNG